MRWLLTNPLQTLSPLGLVAVGTVVGIVGVPALKKTVRGIAVMTVRGALAINDVIKGTRESASQNLDKIMQEVRSKPDEVILSSRTVPQQAEGGTFTNPPLHAERTTHDIVETHPVVNEMKHSVPKNRAKPISSKAKSKKSE